MNRTFKGSSQFRDERTLKVDSLYGDARLLLDAPGKELLGIALDKNDVPALALAEMEAAGYTENDRDDSGLTHFAIAMLNFRLGIETQERIAAEAKERKQLEAEALELINAWMESCGAGRYPSWAHVESGRKKQGLAVARKARELNKEAGE